MTRTAEELRRDLWRLHYELAYKQGHHRGMWVGWLWGFVAGASMMYLMLRELGL